MCQDVRSSAVFVARGLANVADHCLVLCLTVLLLVSCAPPAPISISIVYSSEKADWLEPLIEVYNQSQQRVRVTGAPAGSINSIRSIIEEGERAAARDFQTFLMAEPQQRRAMELGFRPADPNLPLVSPLDSSHGMDLSQPSTILQLPTAPVIRELLKLWEEM